MATEVPYPLPDNLRVPNFGTRILRFLFTEVYEMCAPAEIEAYKDTIPRTNELMDNEHALLILGLHFTRREGFDFITRPSNLLKQIYKLPAVMPIAFHQYVDKKTKSLLQLLTRLSGVTLAPVVNSDTIDKGLNKVPGTNVALKLGYGFPEYIRLMTELVKHHGVSGIAAQAGRRKTLEIEQARQRTLETLLVAMARGLENERRRTQPDSPRIPLEQVIRQFKIAIMLMPIRPMYKADYEEIYGKYELFKRNHIQIGPVFTIDELYQVRDQTNERLKARFDEAKARYEEDKLTRRGIEDPTLNMKDHVTLDEIVLTILSFGSDPEYNRISREEGWVKAIVEVIDLVEAVRDCV